MNNLDLRLEVASRSCHCATLEVEYLGNR